MTNEHPVAAVGPLDLVCYHVGGYGDYSHANILGQTFPARTVYVAFEARSDDSDVKEQEHYLGQGIRTRLIQECVSDRIGKEAFYINTSPASSSIFPPARRALREQRPGDEGDLSWQANTTLDRVVELSTTTLDHVVRSGVAPPPDMLSIDAQGAELKILNGGKEAIASDVLLVITEVEFHTIYEGQPLFPDQFNLLYSQGFRLAEIFAQQYWHPRVRAGYGLLTVGEALFLRDPEEFLAVPNIPDDTRINKLIKLAVLAFLFGRLSVMTHTLNIGAERFGRAFLDRLAAEPDYAVLRSTSDYINANLDRYREDPLFFDHSDYLVSRYGPVEELGRPSLRKVPTYPYAPTSLKELEAEVAYLKKELARERSRKNK